MQLRELLSRSAPTSSALGACSWQLVAWDRRSLENTASHLRCTLKEHTPKERPARAGVSPAMASSTQFVANNRGAFLPPHRTTVEASRDSSTMGTSLSKTSRLSTSHDRPSATSVRAVLAEPLQTQLTVSAMNFPSTCSGVLFTQGLPSAEVDFMAVLGCH